MSDITEESLEITDSHGKAIGIAPRSEIHGNPSLIHRVVHVLVFNKKGYLFLQKRSETKDVAPGKWDTSVGGHVNPGENLLQAAKREMKEELGISECNPEFLYSYIHNICNSQAECLQGNHTRAKHRASHFHRYIYASEDSALHQACLQVST